MTPTISLASDIGRARIPNSACWRRGAGQCAERRTFAASWWKNAANIAGSRTRYGTGSSGLWLARISNCLLAKRSPVGIVGATRQVCLTAAPFRRVGSPPGKLMLLRRHFERASRSRLVSSPHPHRYFRQ